MEKEKSISETSEREQAEKFFAIMEKCTPAQKQYFAGVLDGMNAERHLAAQRTASA